MTVESKPQLLARANADIVVGAPRSITVEKVRTLAINIIDSILGTIKDAEITVEGIPGLATWTSPRRGALRIKLQRYQDGIQIFQLTNDGSQNAYPVSFYSSFGGSLETWIGESNQIVNKKWYIGSGSGEGGAGALTSMMELWGDLSPPNGRTLIVRASPVGAAGVAILDLNGVEKIRVLTEGHMEFLDAMIGIIKKSPNGTRWLQGVSNAGVTTWTDLTPGALPAANPDPSIATFNTDWNAAQPSVPVACYYGWGTAGVTHSGGFTDSYADLMGRVGGVGPLQQTSSGDRPAWDAANERSTFAAGTKWLETAEVEWLRSDRPLTAYFGGVVSNNGQQVMKISDLDFGSTRRLLLKVEVGTPNDIRAVYTNAIAVQSVAPGTARRLIRFDHDGQSFVKFGVQVFNAARVEDFLSPRQDALNNALIVSPYDSFNGGMVAYGVPNAAQETVLKNWLNAKTLHAPSYA
jgi:hypothetical protein